MTVTISPEGLPVVIPKLEFGDGGEQEEQKTMIPHEQAFDLLDRCLREVELELWLVMDRLDEASRDCPMPRCQRSELFFARS